MAYFHISLTGSLFGEKNSEDREGKGGGGGGRAEPVD